MNKKVLKLAAKLSQLATEMPNSHSAKLDTLSPLEFTQLMNEQDRAVTDAISRVLEPIAATIELAANSLRSGGRIVYVGAGTSGRLGVLDASEIPPTFSMPSDKVVALLAGGKQAMFEAREGIEDDPEQGKQDISHTQVDQHDTVIAIAASGRTPYALGALTEANSRNAATVSITCNPGSPLDQLANVAVCLEVGPEVLSGSTRMKSGSAQKMVLNMISTGAMVQLGKCYGNRMVDVNASNEKLKARALNLVVDITACDEQAALTALSSADWNVKEAAIMVSAGITKEEAAQLLAANDGQLRRAMQSS